MIEKLLNTKKINYSSNLNGDHLKQKIEDLFKQSSLSFVGKFTSSNEFAAYDKWSIISWYLPNFKRKSAYLKGEIFQSEKGTLLKLNTRPNTMLSAFPILYVLIGIIILIAAELNKENMLFLIIGSVFILTGILNYLLGIFSRNRLENNFEKNLDLQKLK